MSLKKRLIATAAVIAMAAAAMYGSTFEMRSEAEVEEKYSLFGDKETIYFWYADDTLTNYLNSAAVSFGEQEGVRVLPVLTSESEYLEAINDASLRTDQIPDVYLLTNDSLGKAYLAGLASEIIDEAGVCSETNFPKAALSAVSYKDKYIAYPLSYETSVLVYNETYLAEWARQQAVKALEEEEIPEDMEDALTDDIAANDASENDTPENDAAAQEEPGNDNRLSKLTEEEYLEAAVPATVDDILYFADTFDVPENVEGVLKWDVSDIFYNYWFVGEYMIVGGDKGDDTKLLDISNQETIQCLEAYKGMNQFFSIEPDTITYDSVVDDFVNGRTVFTIATTDIVKRLEEAKEEGNFAYDYGIATLPDVNAELDSRSMSVTNTVVVNGYSAHKELANRFAQYLTGEFSSDMYERTGKVPALLKGCQSGALQIMMLAYEDSVPLPKMMETENFWMYLEVLFSKIWNGADVAEALGELDAQMRVQLGHIELQ
ncbi:MAG: extracellular solute-binding protein [Lachnospiraceae bacterium]|nr:extracellular solute-binding protein [Lachnospiraceae bacterium]